MILITNSAYVHQVSQGFPYLRNYTEKLIFPLQNDNLTAWVM